MSRKSRFSLVVTLLIASLAMASPYNSLTLLASAFARGAAAVNRTSPATASSSDAATKTRVAENYAKLPLHFEPLPAGAGFISRGLRYGLWLTADGATLALKNDAARTTVQMQMLGANPQQRPAGVGPQAAVSNYYFGSDPAKWHTGVVRFAQVKYDQVYPGVDPVFYGNQRQLEYDFIVAPGADPNQIKLSFTDADAMKLDDNGDLLFVTKGGELRQHRPVIYQEANGARRK